MRVMVPWLALDGAADPSYFGAPHKLVKPRDNMIAVRVGRKVIDDRIAAALACTSQSPEERTMSDIAERVKKIVVEHLGVDESKVSESASFIDDLGADSLDTVELVMAFEEEFGCEIPDDAAEKILTVGDATGFLEKNTG